MTVLTVVSENLLIPPPSINTVDDESVSFTLKSFYLFL